MLHWYRSVRCRCRWLIHSIDCCRVSSMCKWPSLFDLEIDDQQNWLRWYYWLVPYWFILEFISRWVWKHNGNWNCSKYCRLYFHIGQFRSEHWIYLWKDLRICLQWRKWSPVQPSIVWFFLSHYQLIGNIHWKRSCYCTNSVLSYCT